jgi:Protein of unknown function (DUF4435)
MNLDYSYIDFLNMVQMSTSKYILVEGRDDEQFFVQLHDAFFGNILELCEEKFQIITAEVLNNINPLGNRRKVQDVCSLMNGEKFACNVVGFVDREFDGINKNDLKSSYPDSHIVVDRLIYSRGHSVENYFFDFEILDEALSQISATPVFRPALNLLKIILPSIMHLACAVSLAAYDCKNRMSLARNSITWKLITIDSSEPNFLLDDWKICLIQEGNTSELEARELCDSYNSWRKSLESIGSENIRWMCDGHMGIKFVLAAYERCVHNCALEVGKVPSQEQARVRINERNIFNAFSRSFAQRSAKDECDYPMEVFKLLGLTL